MLTRQRRAGFVLVEAAATVVVCGLLVVVLLIASLESRRCASLGSDIHKLRALGAGTLGYAADNDDLFWTFSWKKGATSSQWPDLNAQAQLSDFAATAAQAVDILRRRAGRLDIPPINGWFPHINYSTLVLQDYLGTPFPTDAVISSADTHRLRWASDPQCFDQGCFLPCQPIPGPANKRWPYSTSFQLDTAFYDQSPAGDRISQTGIPSPPNAYSVPSSAMLSAGRLTEVAYPSHKVHLHDSFARHFGSTTPYCTRDEAKLPFLFGDGSVRVQTAGHANPGWQPNLPTSPQPTTHATITDWCDPNPLPAVVTAGRFRWTRGFLAGRDFAGAEVCTGQPGCP